MVDVSFYINVYMYSYVYIYTDTYVNSRNNLVYMSVSPAYHSIVFFRGFRCYRLKRLPSAILGGSRPHFRNREKTLRLAPLVELGTWGHVGL